MFVHGSTTGDVLRAGQRCDTVLPNSLHWAVIMAEPQVETNKSCLSRIVLGEFGEVWGRWGGSRSLLSLETPEKLYMALSPFSEESALPKGTVLGVIL